MTPQRLKSIEDVFRNSVLPVDGFRPDRDAGFYVLLILAGGFAVYLLSIIGAILLNFKEFGLLNIYFLDPWTTVESIGKITVLMSFALLGAYNRNVRREAVALLIIAHLIVVASALTLYAAYPQNPFFPQDRQYLLMNGVVDGIVLLLLLAIFPRARIPKPDPSVDEEIELKTPASAWLRTLLIVYGVGFGLIGLGVLCARSLLPPSSTLGAIVTGHDPLLVNVLAKYWALAAVCLFLVRRASLRRILIPVVTLVLSVAAAAATVSALCGDTVIITRDNTALRIPWVMPLHVIVNACALTLLLGLRRLQYRVDLQITALRPSSADCVIALHEAFREESQKPHLSSREVLRRIDEFIIGMRGRQRGIIAFPFWIIEHVFPPLVWLRPPFSILSRPEQRWMLRRYMLRPGYERSKSLIPPLAEAMFAIGDIAHSLLTFAYYSSSYGQAEVGYILPNARGRLQGDIAAARPPDMVQPQALPTSLADPSGLKPFGAKPHLPLLAPRIVIPPGPSSVPSDVDYCIIGSGAAGGVLAFRLGAAKGRSNTVCVLERGGYHSPLQDFDDDEMHMIRMLYADGGLQSTRNFDFTILQGECVGGSTVVNNALCFEMPEVSKNEWRGFGIDVDTLEDHYQQVAKEIQIEEMTPEMVNHRVEELFSKGIAGSGSRNGAHTPLPPARRMRGNFSDCIGCGLYNIGCRRMRKMSVLETYLPWAQAHGVRVIPHVDAIQCRTVNAGGRKKVTSLLVRRPNGEFQTIRINKALIVAGGAIASSRFLMRSGLGGVHVGKGVACNYAFPSFVEFRETLDAFDGLQMSLFAAPDSHEMVFETTFNPPGSQAIMTPQYFADHERMMKAFRSSMVIVALVGSDPTGSVSQEPSILFGRAVDWAQTDAEIQRVKTALSETVRIARAAGATRVLLPTHPVLEIPIDETTDPLLDAFQRQINGKEYFRFATPHPQGGNMMADGRHPERVVEPDFRVRDCENIYVCDASIFPRGIRINPQWTIMALASRAGMLISESTT